MDKDVIYAKWLSGEMSDADLVAQAGNEALSELKQIRAAADKLSMPKYDTVKGYEKFISNNAKKTKAIRRINWRWVTGIAASLVILIFAWFSFMSNQDQTLKAGNGVNEYLAMTDGSEIKLNDGSEISYNQDKWSTARNISLTGEAFFQVSKGSPFKVKTANGYIEVLGTEFNVRAWGDKLYVECYEGRVRVTSNGKQTILTAFESVNVVTGNMKKKQAISNTIPSWQSGSSRFYDESIKTVFEELERQYKIKVNTTLINQSFSGSFNHNNLENAIKSICIPMGLEYQISNDQKVVFIQ